MFKEFADVNCHLMFSMEKLMNHGEVYGMDHEVICNLSF